MDSEKLINEVRNRKLLWDVTAANYKDKKKVKRAWDEVGDALNLDGDSAKRKWRSLRNNYTQERAKITKQFKSGSGASESYASKWRFFADMDFLRGVTTPAKLSGNLDNSLLDSILSEEVRIAEPRGTPPIGDPEVEIKHENTQQDTEKEQTEIGNGITHSEKNRCKKRRIPQELEFIDLEREKLNILKIKEERKTDGDYHFLISFLPHMHQMSQHKNARFRLRMSQLLMETLEGDEGAEPSRERAEYGSTPKPTSSVN